MDVRILPNPALKRLGHIFGGQRPGTRPAGGGIVVRLIPDKSPDFIRRERHAVLHQTHETAHAVDRLDQRGIAVHPAAGRQFSRHLLRAVRLCKGELVIGLLIAPGVPGGSALDALRHHCDIFHAEFCEPVGGGKTRRAAPDDDNPVLLHACLPH